jgi:hypothetical protein
VRYIIGRDIVNTNMADQNERVQLEAERHRLLSMIAYHDRPFAGSSRRAPAWFVVVAIAIICGIGISIVAGLLAGQISPSGFLFLVVGLPLLAYILTRNVMVFGMTFSALQSFTLSLGEQPVLALGGRPAGETEVRQRLADCEARIMKLKEGRP